MGRKDAIGARSAPVDQYRKQIGKQDWKRGKKDLKALKTQADMKNSAMTAKDVVLITVALLLVLVGLYLGLFWSLTKDDT